MFKASERNKAVSNPQLDLIKEAFPVIFHPWCQDILRLKNYVEDAETKDGELAAFIRLNGSDLLEVLSAHLQDALKDDQQDFWLAVNNCAKRESNPLERVLARWREHNRRGCESKPESHEESYKRTLEDYIKCLTDSKSNEIISSEILNAIDNCLSFSLDEFYSMVERNPKAIGIFTRSKRLAAIVTLHPEPLRNILKKHPEALHHLVFSRFDPQKNSFLDPSTIIRGDENFIELALSTPGPFPQLTLAKALAAVGTQRALICAREVLHSLPNTPYCTPGFESSFSPRILNVLQLSCLPEDRPWLAEYLVTDQELLAEALKFVADDRATQWHGNVEYWFSLIRNETLLSLAMAIYASDPSCSDIVWRNTVRRLLSNDNTVAMTAKLADTLPNKNNIIEAQLRLELGNFLDCSNFETAEATIRFSLSAIPEFFDKLGIKLTPSGIAPTDNFKGSPQGTIHLWTWLNGELLQGQTPHDVKGIVSFLYKKLKPFHDDQAEQPNVQLFSALHDVDRNKYFGALKNRFSLCLVEPERDSSLVEQLILAAKDRIFSKVRKFSPASAEKIVNRLDDEYPSRFRLEHLLTKDLGWPVAEEGNETFKLLDRLDDDTLPGLLRESLSVLVHSREDLWHRFCYLATFLREVYPDYPQAWVKAIVPLLDKEKYKDLDPEWIRALANCLGFLRETWGNKVPQLLRSITHDPSLGDLCEDIRIQAAQFNRENFKKGHHRLERRRVDDVKRYLARTSRLVERKHKIQ